MHATIKYGHKYTSATLTIATSVCAPFLLNKLQTSILNASSLMTSCGVNVFNDVIRRHKFVTFQANVIKRHILPEDKLYG